MIPAYTSFTVALETNGRGHIGFVQELPGAFIRGITETDALAKLSGEVRSYYGWLRQDPPTPVTALVSQRSSSLLAIEDADSGILLDVDTIRMEAAQFDLWTRLVMQSGTDMERLCRNTPHADRLEADLVRPTFYGDRPASIRHIRNHVIQTQGYYVSRLGLAPPKGDDLLDTRRRCLIQLTTLFSEAGNEMMREIDGERWTVKKMVRRFLWHDRIHAKAIVRILARQKRDGLIEAYDDPFSFGI